MTFHGVGASGAGRTSARASSRTAWITWRTSPASSQARSSSNLRDYLRLLNALRTGDTSTAPTGVIA